MNILFIAEIKPWQFLIPIASLGIGWLLNEFSQWFRTRREDKKILNGILYNLMQTYAVLKTINHANIQNALKRTFIKIPQFQQTSVPDGIISYITTVLISIQVQNVVDNDLATIKTNFSSSITELSKIYPLIAFELLSSMGIKSTFDSLENMVLKLEEVLKTNSPQGETIPSLGEFLQPMLIEQSLTGLSEDILYLSGKIGRITKHKSKKTLGRLTADINEDVIEKAAAFLQELIKKLSDLEAGI